VESGADQQLRHINANLFGAGKDSGTFDYFTEAVVGKEDVSRSDYVASEEYLRHFNSRS
jgi:hypothetical protein